MNDRLITAAGAAAALVVFVALLFPGTAEPPVTRPTSVETGPNGYAGLARWLEAEAVPVHSLKARVDALWEWPLPASGNLLITTMPHRQRLRFDEMMSLRDWIHDGNTLLVPAALNDSPRWALNVDTTRFLPDLETLTGVYFSASGDEAVAVSGSPTGTGAVVLEGLPAHPLMAGVARLHGESDAPASVWAASRMEGGPAVVQLAREASSGVGSVWQMRLGDGHVIVASLGSLLTNRALAEADNRRLVANLLAWHLGPNGAVIFDDLHQGLSELYDPEAFFADPRLGATLLFVLGFWALYVIGGSDRLTPPLPRRERPNQAGFVAAVGGFLARKLSAPEAGLLMVEGWLDELRRRHLIGHAGSPWSSLAALAALEPAVLERLRRQHDAMLRGETVDLPQVHNTLEELRRMLR